ncbi:MAG: hypothetical protein H0T84_09190 [Tatlockia sp.]|nr:hypothetical protein [Tatlockia sp.]
MPLFSFSDYTPSDLITSTEENKFSHIVSKGTLTGSNKTWFCKELEDPATARLELLVQEFFRLIIPHQPETLLACNHDTGVYYILSEEVQGYRKLPLREEQKFFNGTYTGLGQAMSVAIFLQEIDFKNGNVCLDSDNRVIKIDGNCCFAGGRYSLGKKVENFKLEPDTIDSLPFPKHYSWVNWLDMDSNKTKSDIIDLLHSYSLSFRAEVNQAMLKICLLPDSFIESFIDLYMPASGQLFIDLIKCRREELQQSVLQNNSFKIYLTTANALSDAINILQQMKSFKSAEEPVIADNQHTQLENDFGQLFSNLLPLVSECRQLLEQLKTHLDPILFNVFYQQYEKNILNPSQVLTMKEELFMALQQAQSVKSAQNENSILQQRQAYHQHFWKSAPEKSSSEDGGYVELKTLIEHGYEEKKTGDCFFIL